MLACLVLACLALAGGFPLVLSPAAAQAPSIIVNYDVLNSLTDMPAGQSESRAAGETPATSIFAVPESRLLIRPEKKSTPTIRRAEAPAQTVPLPRAKPPLPEALAARGQQQGSLSTAAPPAAPPTAPPTASSSPSPDEAEAPEPTIAQPAAQPAPETAPAAPAVLPVPPPPPEAPQIAELTSSAEPAAPPVAELPAVPESPAASESGSEAAKENTAASDESGAPAESATAMSAAAEALHILFDTASVELNDAAKAVLTELAQSLCEDADRKVELRAHATGTGGSARRTSLSRARAVRSFLVDKGVATTRIDVRPLGATSKGGPPDRVDIVDARR